MEAKSVGAERKGNIHHLGIFLGLLHTKTDGVVGILGFNNGDGCGSIVVEHVVGILRFATSYEIATQVNLTIRKLYLRFHRDISH